MKINTFTKEIIMFRSYLIASLFLSVFLMFGGCAKKIVPDVEPSPTPAVKEIISETVTPPAVKVRLNLDDKRLETVLFGYDSSDLTLSGQKLLKNHAEWLMRYPSVKATIEGHCDERGSNEYNQLLGERRALSTKNYLAELGVAPERLTIVSYGEERPAQAGHVEAAWKQNRRVEFK